MKVNVADHLTDSFFEKMGFDISSEPFRKEVTNGVIFVYKNYMRDGSRRYDGYMVTAPRTFHAGTVTDYLDGLLD